MGILTKNELKKMAIESRRKVADIVEQGRLTTKNELERLATESRKQVADVIEQSRRHCR